MPQSDDAAAWFAAVYQAVQEVPPGKVTTYGHIARLVGHQRLTRHCSGTSQVGVCLKHLPSDTSLPYHNGNVPWQRVINARGTISQRGNGAAARQALALQNEGVEVDTNSMGEYAVSFDTYGWFPDHLADV